MVLVASREWFPDLLALLVDLPRELPTWVPLLNSLRGAFSQRCRMLKFHAGRLSSISTERETFPRLLPEHCPLWSGSPLRTLLEQLMLLRLLVP